MFFWLLVLHILGASIWIGGHLLLCFRYLPESLETKNPSILTSFEKKFEPIGFPALIIQVVTGVWMAIDVYGVRLFRISNTIETCVTLKLCLLVLTLLLALNVRLFILPKLNKNNIRILAYHIIAVTTISVVMLFLGVAIRLGGI